MAYGRSFNGVVALGGGQFSASGGGGFRLTLSRHNMPM